MIRQGDALLIPVMVEETELEPGQEDPRGLVLAEGETSGHYHAVFGHGAKLMRYKSDHSRTAVVGLHAAAGLPPPKHMIRRTNEHHIKR